MESPQNGPAEQVPLGQRFFDNIFLLFALGILVTGVVYVAWGLWEILTLPMSPLP
ncbi:MAG TPA: hypothetical protein VIQ74_03460 [Gemmatimonadaceae bacterium]|jgi:hypothetical protein